MPDVQTPAAESSPVATPAVEIEIPTDGPGYDEWRKTGKLPEPKPSSSESAPETKPSSESADEVDENDAPASEAGKKPQEQKSRSNAETRIRELIAQNKKLQAELEQRSSSPAKPAESQPAKEAAAELKPPQKPVKPRLDDFKTLDEYEKAVDAYETARDTYAVDLAKYEAELALQKFQQKQQQEAAQKAVSERIAEARKRYQDYDTVAGPVVHQLMNAADVHPAVKVFVNDSPVLPDVLYVLGGDEKGLADFIETAKANPTAAIRKLVVLEGLVQQELAKGGKADDAPRDETGKFTKAPEKKVTEAPAPPKEVGGKGTPPPDDVEAAAKAAEGDDANFDKYRDAANRRDLQRRRR